LAIIFILALTCYLIGVDFVIFRKFYIILFAPIDVLNWHQNGLNIVNGFSFCLKFSSFNIKINDCNLSVQLIVNVKCDNAIMNKWLSYASRAEQRYLVWAACAAYLA